MRVRVCMPYVPFAKVSDIVPRLLHHRKHSRGARVEEIRTALVHVVFVATNDQMYSHRAVRR
jgi:alkylhydroperoxidase/carboxymuconolactone decarboxylase family protein YurZ